MSDIGDSAGLFLKALVYCLSWAFGLAVAARYVFGSTKTVAGYWFYAGLAINVVIGILIPMGMYEMERSSSTMLATMGGFPVPGEENNERLRQLHVGLVMIPILAVAIGTVYMTFRRVLLNRPSDVEENQTEA